MKNIRAIAPGIRVRQSAAFLQKQGARPDDRVYTVLECDCGPCVQGRWVALDVQFSRERPAWRHIVATALEVVL